MIKKYDDNYLNKKAIKNVQTEYQKCNCLTSLKKDENQNVFKQRSKVLYKKLTLFSVPIFYTHIINAYFKSDCVLCQ